MAVPSHDITCTTRAVQVECDDCGELVWYFKCSCGSKRFFESLGHPWYQHYCREYAIRRQLETIVNLERLSNDEIYQMLLKNERLSGLEVDDSIWRVVNETVGRRRSKLEITNVVPEEGIAEVSGKVMELNNQVNIFTRLGFDASNPMSVKLLGKIGSTKWAYAKVRSHPDRANRCYDHHILIPIQYLIKNSLKLGDFIVGITQSRSHAKGLFSELTKHDVY